MPASAGPATQQMAATAPATPDEGATQTCGREEERRTLLVPCRGMAAHGAGRSARPHLGEFGRRRYRHGTATRQPPFTFRRSSVTPPSCAGSGRLTPWPAPRPPRVWSPSSSPPAPEPASGGRAQARRRRRRRPLGGRPRRRRGPRVGHRAGRRGHRRTAGDGAAPGGRARRQRAVVRRPDHVTARGDRRRRAARRRGGRRRPRRPAVRHASTHGGRSPRWTPRSSSPPTTAGADTRCGCAATRGTCCRTTATRARGRSWSVDPIS